MKTKSVPVATVAVRDLAKARDFYEGKLGHAKSGSQGSEVVTYSANGAGLVVYRSQFAGTNRATSVTWEVADVAAAVKELKAKGIAFEHYDMPDTVLEGDVHFMGDIRAAWFKDPDGNIHCLAEG